VLRRIVEKLLAHKRLLIGAAIFLLYIVTYRTWIFSRGILTFGDWPYVTLSSQVDHYLAYLYIWKGDESLGSVVLDSGQAITYLPYGLLAKYLGVGFSLAERLVHFWPVLVLTPVSAFIFARTFFKSKLAIIGATATYCFNIYILTIETGFMTFAGAYALVPLVYVAFKKTIEAPSAKNVTVTALVFCVCSAYEPRIFYIVLWVLAGYTAYYFIAYPQTARFSSAAKIAAAAAAPVVLYILANMYWILGLTKASSLTGNVLLSKSLFGSGYWSLREALTLFYPWWDGGQPVAFIVHPIPAYMWAIPIAAGLGFIVQRKSKQVTFFAAVTLLGILLSKQSDYPFPQLYSWLFAHWPEFSAYREPTMFYILIALGYTVLIGALLEWLWLNRQKSILRFIALWVSSGLLLGIFASNLVPVVSGSIGTLFVARSTPSDYLELNRYILSDTSFSRLLWFPASSRWGVFTNVHPKLEASDLVPSTSTGVFGLNSSVQGATYRDQVSEIFKPNYAEAIFAALGIKYLIVPSADFSTGDDPFSGYGDDRQFFVDSLNSVPWLNRVNIGTSQIAVYENRAVKPYISALSSVFSLAIFPNLEQKYSFITGTLGGEFAFTPEGGSVKAINVRDPFESPDSHSVVSDTLKTTISSARPQVAYINTNHFSVSYQITNGVLDFIEHKIVGLNAGNAPIGPQVNETAVISSTSLSPAGEFEIEQGTNLIPVNLSDTSAHDMGQTAPTLYSAQAGNEINNPDFENGLWRPVVEDCNKFDNSGLINMSLVYDPSQVAKVLELSAFSHIACTGPDPVGVTAGQKLMLSFDYRVVKGQEAGYQLVWGGPSGNTARYYLRVSDSSWRTERTLVTVPPGATSLRVLLEAIPNDQIPVEGVSHYTNIRLTALTATEIPPISTAPQYVQDPIPAGTRTVSVSDPSLSGDNLVPNPSFESGLWQKTVGDCNNYDDNPDLSMSLDAGSHSVGRQSLELGARRHTACTGPEAISVQESQSYLLSFDYQSPNASSAGYSISFNDPNHTSVSNNSIPIKGDGWQTYNQTFTVPFGATQATLTVYADALDPPTTTIINRYDNFSLVEIPNVAGQYYLVSGNQTELAKPKNITFTPINPAKKLVHITGATTPFYIAMSEGYNPQWRLELANSRVQGFLASWIPWVHPDAVSNSDHFDLDDFVNGWYIDAAGLCKYHPAGCTINKDGSYNLEMIAEFAPQRWFDVGVVISVMTLLACIGFLLWAWRRRWQVAVHWTGRHIGIPQAWLLAPQTRQQRPNLENISRRSRYKDMP
jgi:hypothetical protein